MKPTPYYEDSWTVVYKGDCREILPALNLPASALLLTDPPYGNDFVHHGKNYPNAPRFADVEIEDNKGPFDPAHLLQLAPERKILWGANWYASRLPDEPGWLIWDKREDSGKKAMGDAELAWTNFLGAVRKYDHLWDGFNKRSERGIKKIHPTQKPLALMRWCISLARKPSLIVDPYMGSGSTLRAAKDMAIPSIGIERDARYLPGAVRRLSQETIWALIEDHTESNVELFTKIKGETHEQKAAAK